ncbi:RL11A, ribosomal protein 11A 60S large ribosomal subunit [Blastocystis sp. ATCC 50177/Nand II]|uniref:50S ribosomal protein L5, chloroplastic n=3 Tax=Blastocystis sp. subtype 1 (strain ATCC 50177 / NandII) TaxID=478820 RepID=A0A196S3I7_BLAHN|nr:RL11A, ribosomal protein 11A 60S large ribosomal subunit [Blastocystis sp. ATCC 50177/Nand II]
MVRFIFSEKANPMRNIRVEKLVINICVGESGDAISKAARVLQQISGQEPVYGKARFTIRSFSIRRNEKISVHATIRGEKALEILERGLKVKEYELVKKNFSDSGNFGFGIQEHIDLGIKYDPNTGIFARFTIRSFSIRRNEKISVHATIRGEKALEILERGLKVKEYELVKKNFSDSGNFGFGIQEHIDLGIKYDPNTGIFGMDFYVQLARPGGRVTKRKAQRSRLGYQHKVTREEAMEWFKKQYDGIILDKAK